MSMQLPISIQNTGSFDAYLTYVNSIPLLDEQQEKSLFLKYQMHNDLNAVERIILSHLRFVAYIARDFKGYGLPIEDLVQEGTVGLMKSVKKFDLDFGVRLASFSIHYIKAEIHEYVIRNWRLVKAATTKAKRKLFFNLRRLKSTTQWLSYKDKADIAHQLQVSEDDINDMEMQMSQSDIYLDTEKDQGDDERLYCSTDKLLEDTSESFTSRLIQQDFARKTLRTVHQAVAGFDSRTRDIIENRWFTDDKLPHKHFAKKYGVSQERIRQLEEKALIQVRERIGCNQHGYI